MVCVVDLFFSIVVKLGDCCCCVFVLLLLLLCYYCYVIYGGIVIVLVIVVDGYLGLLGLLQLVLSVFFVVFLCFWLLLCHCGCVLDFYAYYVYGLKMSQGYFCRHYFILNELSFGT